MRLNVKCAGPLGRAEASGNEPAQEFVVEQEKAQGENQVIEKRVIRGEDDAQLPRRDDEKTNEAYAAREEQHEDQA